MRWTCEALDNVRSQSAQQDDRLSRASFFVISTKYIYWILGELIYRGLPSEYYNSLYNCPFPLGRIQSFVYLHVGNSIYVFCKCTIYDGTDHNNDLVNVQHRFDLNQHGVNLRIMPIPLMLITHPVAVAPLPGSDCHTAMRIS
jgi:hypothetical protein